MPLQNIADAIVEETDIVAVQDQGLIRKTDLAFVVQVLVSFSFLLHLPKNVNL